MDWYEKEDAYCIAFENGRVCTNLWKYIPKKLMGAVTNCVTDSDGYWIWLDHKEGGWSAYDHGDDCGIIHEYTIADLKAAIKTISK